MDWNPSQSLTSVKRPFVAGVNLPLRIVWERSHYFNFMTSRAELPDHCIKPCLSGADLGQEILGQDEELHVWICGEMSG